MANATLMAALRNLIPGALSQFNKLTQGEPYRFDSWRDDSQGEECLYFSVDLHDGSRARKRIRMREFEAVVKHLRETGRFTREVFRVICPVAASDGPCSFAVVGRTLEALGIARYQRAEFLLTDSAKTDFLLRITSPNSK